MSKTKNKAEKGATKAKSDPAVANDARTDHKPTGAREQQSAAAPSPFPPIADYAFLSDCHTGALVAPDGSIDWLCVPRFDAPSIFGNLLDRQGGSFRLGPFGINVPSGRVYEPGTNILVTTWKTPGGWILVRDALTMGPRRGEDEVTPHTRPPVDEDGDHLLVRTVLCLDGSVQVELICDPVFDYGRTPAQWNLVGDDRHTADASGAGVTVRLRTDMALGIEGDWIRARHELGQGDQVYCSLSWAEGLASPQTVDELGLVGKRVNGPNLVNVFEGGKTPMLAASELAEMGFRLGIYPSQTHRAAIRAAQRVLAVLKEDGHVQRVEGDLCTFQEREVAVGTAAWRALEEKYMREG